jgi:hypothetical protein
MVQECDVLLSWYPSPGRWLAWLAAVVLPAPTLHAVTKLLELLVTRLGLILFVAVLCTSYEHSELVPSDFNEQMLHLVNYIQRFIKSDTTLDHTYSMMQWQLTCPSLRVNSLTLNLYFFVLFCFVSF